ncbi:MAG: PIN domain-containing protein [Streptosporangiaceae bacterium]
MARLRGRVGGGLVLDAEGIVKFADGDPRTLERLRYAWRRNGYVITAASALAEVLRGGPRDAKVHRVLSRVTVVPIDKALGRAAGELLGRARLSGHRCTIDALLAAVALGLPRPVVLLTSDPDDLARLTEEPGRARAERIAVVRV